MVSRGTGPSGLKVGGSGGGVQGRGGLRGIIGALCGNWQELKTWDIQ